MQVISLSKQNRKCLALILKRKFVIWLFAWALAVVNIASFAADNTPQLVLDISPGITGSNPEKMVNFKGEVYFFAEDDEGKGLWKSDGTANGTLRLLLIMPNTPGAYAGELIAMQDKVFFRLRPPGLATLLSDELWVTTGTPQSTEKFFTLPPTYSAGNNALFTHVNNKIYFRAFSSGAGGELWVSDGTAAGTSLIADIKPGAMPSGLTKLFDVNGELFLALKLSGPCELWKFDAVNEVAVQLKVFDDSWCTIVNRPVKSAGGLLYFISDTDGSGVALWVSDGTPVGTIAIDINSTGDSSPELMTVVGDEVFFAATDNTGLTTLWKSNGTAQGTVNVSADVTPEESMSAFNGKLVFNAIAFATSIFDKRLWISNGEVGGTQMIGTAVGSNILYSLTTTNNAFYFIAGTGPNAELWTSKGTDESTEFIADIVNVIGQKEMLGVGNKLFYSQSDTQHGEELWVITTPEDSMCFPVKTSSGVVVVICL
ncbi:MAG: hypothetical protein V3V09_01825 [Arenicellales bacterium]